MRIGEVAKRTGVSVHLLRQWDRRYQIGPSTTSEGGQRLYQAADIDRIRFILDLKDEGFSFLSSVK